MAENPVTTSDIEARWRPLSESEQELAQALLDDAWVILQATAPNMSADLDSGALSEGIVRAVVTSAALRVLRNPDGNKSESVDDYSWTRDSSVSAGALYFNDAELQLIRGVRSRATSMRVTPW